MNRWTGVFVLGIMGCATLAGLAGQHHGATAGAISGAAILMLVAAFIGLVGWIGGGFA